MTNLIDGNTFKASIKMLSELPGNKRMSEQSIDLLWILLNKQVKREVTTDMWAHGVACVMDDPERFNMWALDRQVLCYIYPRENMAPSLKRGISLCPDNFPRPVLSEADIKRIDEASDIKTLSS